MHAGVKRKRVEVHAACPADWSSLYLPRARHGDGDRSDSGRPDVASSPDSGGRSKVDASLDTQYLAAVRAAAHVSIWCQRALSSNSGQRRFMIAVRYQTRLIHHPRLVRRCAIISVRIACAVLSPRCSSRPASQRSWNCSHNRRVPVWLEQPPTLEQRAVSSARLQVMLSARWPLSRCCSGLRFCEALRLRVGVAER